MTELMTETQFKQFVTEAAMADGLDAQRAISELAPSYDRLYRELQRLGSKAPFNGIGVNLSEQPNYLYCDWLDESTNLVLSWEFTSKRDIICIYDRQATEPLHTWSFSTRMAQALAILFTAPPTEYVQ